MTFDLVLRGGTVATAGEVFAADIGITEGRIAALAERIPPGSGAREMDVTGRLVLPGGIDAHVHIDQAQSPGAAAAGAVMADGFRTGTTSAAFGGTTTTISFAVQHRGTSLREAVADYHRRAEGNAVVDYSFHLTVTDPTPAVLGQELPALIAAGCRSLKVYMTYEAMRLGDREILEVMAVARAHRAVVLVHAENHEVLTWLAERLEATGETRPVHHARSRPLFVEREATHRALTLSEAAGAPPTVIVHVSGAEPIEEIRRARARGLTVLAETCPQYLFLSEGDLDLPDMEGAKAMCSPPPRDAASQAACWRGLEDGTFDLFNSDHAPYRMDGEGKLRAGPNPPFRRVANGIPGLATRLPLLFSEGVMTGRIPLTRFVALTSTNNARLYGLAPRKGTVAVGADADLAVWDPERQVTVTNELLHHAVDYTPYEGMRITGWPETVLSRGEVVVAEGALQARPGRGRFLEQALSSAYAEAGRWI